MAPFGCGRIDGEFFILSIIRKDFFPLTGTQRFIKYNISDGNAFQFNHAAVDRFHHAPDLTFLPFGMVIIP